MGRKLKRDEDGHVVIEEDKVVYFDDDGEERKLDWQHSIGKIREVSDDRDDWRTRGKKAIAALELFGDISADDARNAIRTIKSYDDKKLVDAGEVDKLKAKLTEDLQNQHREFTESQAAVLKLRDKALAEKDGQIRRLMVSNSFERSPFLNKSVVAALRGKNGESVWGDHFHVENGEVVPYESGDRKLYSKEKPGELAEFEEAIQLIVMADPRKDDYLISGHAGGDDHGETRTTDHSPGAVTLTREQAKDTRTYRAAREAAEKKGVTLSIAKPA